MRCLLVNAHDSISSLFQECDDRAPALRVVPVLALGGTLNGDADIGFSDRPCIIFDRESWPHLRWINSENIAGGAMQPDMAKVARLMDEVLVIEKQTYAVGGVVTLRIDLFVGSK